MIDPQAPTPRTRPKSSPANPLTQFDMRWRKKHQVEHICGVDEAGRGPLAGPVVAACVVLKPGTRLPGVNDSKLLALEEREKLAPRIIERAVGWGVGWATAAEIDRINVLQATLLAAGRALSMLPAPPELLLTDYLKIPNAACHCEPLVDGDARSQAVASASILAKVARDRIMTALDVEYPDYGFASHKGYGAPVHRQALDRVGPSSLHRLSFRGVCTEPFFSNRPPPIRVRCRSLPRLGAIGAPPPVDWLCLLTEPARHPVEAFLPECDWLPSALDCN